MDPAPFSLRSLSFMAPPPARGWTRYDIRILGAEAGSPACAGMDPIIWMQEKLNNRLPRLRGDGP